MMDGHDSAYRARIALPPPPPTDPSRTRPTRAHQISIEYVRRIPGGLRRIVRYFGAPSAMRQIALCRVAAVAAARRANSRDL